MVDEDIKSNYESILAYLQSKIASYDDPTTPQDELQDHLEGFDLTSAVHAIQNLITRQPSLVEAAVIKAYRDLRAIQAEYQLRKMTRKDYYLDACTEESDNHQKWTYNKKKAELRILGKDSGA